MKKRNFVVIAVGLAALLIAGGLFASNMGFKLNYPLDATGTGSSASGTNTIGLPYYQQTSLAKASDLRADINATAGGNVVLSISKFIRSTDGLFTYTGASAATDFVLVPGEGYRVQVNTDVPYIVVGSHNPSLAIQLDAAGSNNSASGTNDYSFPYHGTATDASDLRDEINAAAGGNVVLSVSKFIRSTDGLLTYTGASAATNFGLTPGNSYRIQVNADVTYSPSHY